MAMEVAYEERPNGPVAAAFLAAGIGSVMVGIMTILNEASQVRLRASSRRDVRRDCSATATPMMKNTSPHAKTSKSRFAATAARKVDTNVGL